MQSIRDRLENSQIVIYFAAVAAGLLAAFALPSATALEAAINPALALMLFVTFLQVPLNELGRAFSNTRFLGALLTTNFVVIPLLVWALLPLAPDDSLIRFGVLLVLLAPCIDYVVTFSHLGRADARLLLASTPVLLCVQVLLLPLYMGVLLGDSTASLIQPEPFIEAFLVLIVVPLGFAAALQFRSTRSEKVVRVLPVLGLLPVPATALVLLIVVASVVPQLGQAREAAIGVLPVYIVFALVAPLAGWLVATMFRLEAPAGRAVAFSGATRNSLVVLPLALSVPGALPLLPAIIVAQTLVELVAELIYVRVLSKFGAAGSNASSA